MLPKKTAIPAGAFELEVDLDWLVRQMTSKPANIRFTARSLATMGNDTVQLETVLCTRQGSYCGVKLKSLVTRAALLQAISCGRPRGMY